MGSTSNTPFGRRGAAPKPAAPQGSPGAMPPAGGEPLTFAEVVRSPLMKQLGGMICGVLLLLSLVGIYVGFMKGMGRALDASWNQKVPDSFETVRRRIENDPDFAGRMNDVCEVRSLNAKFREIQKELGC